MSSLESILKKKGPCLSSDLVKILVEEDRVSNEAARKRVSRLGVNIHRLEGLPFPRNAKFIYLKKDFRSPFFWQALFAAFKETNSAYWFAISAIEEREGIIPYDHFLIACGSPIRQKKHLPPQTIVERLVRHEVFFVKEVEGIGKCIVLTKYEDDLSYLLTKLKSRLIVEKIIILAVSNWVKNMGFVSYNLLKTRLDDQLPVVSTLAWDLAGQSYLYPLVESQRGSDNQIKSGFFACDILLNRKVSVDGVQPFLRKCQTLRGLTNVGKCVQMFVANDYHVDAFRNAKEAGVLPATIENLFGKDIAKGLKNLLRTLEEAAKSVILEPEKFSLLFDSLSRIEGIAGNLRGALFEYFSASVAQRIFPTRSIKLNQIFKLKTGDSAESDLVIELHNDEVIFIECKGHISSVTVDHKEVERWLHIRVPRIRKYALEHPEWCQRKLTFSLWTSGKFMEDSIKLLQKAQSSTSKYNIVFQDGEELLKIIREFNDKEMTNTFRKCFLEHPIN